MAEMKRSLRSAKERAAFVKECEERFEKRLDEVAAELVSSGTRIIALSGPTCSGKTTTANKLTAELEACGKDVHLVSIDNFFLERDVLDEAAERSGKPLDYDSVKAIDLALLEERAASIIKGDPTELPVFDFKTGKRTHYETVDPDDASVFIFEGIQAIYPEVTALFGKDYRSVYISVEDDIEMGDVYFGKRDVRLMRRLLRDYQFRGAHPDFTFHLWRSVAANEDRAILPYVDTVDLRINSTMPYEVCVMKKLLPPVLDLVSDTAMHYPKALEIGEKLKKLDVIDPALVPEASVLREFIGK